MPRRLAKEKSALVSKHTTVGLERQKDIANQGKAKKCRPFNCSYVYE
jgi:hypothetical protein